MCCVFCVWVCVCCVYVCFVCGCVCVVRVSVNESVICVCSSCVVRVSLIESLMCVCCVGYACLCGVRPCVLCVYVRDMC